MRPLALSAAVEGRASALGLRALVCGCTIATRAELCGDGFANGTESLRDVRSHDGLRTASFDFASVTARSWKKQAGRLGASGVAVSSVQSRSSKVRGPQCQPEETGADSECSVTWLLLLNISQLSQFLQG